MHILILIVNMEFSKILLPWARLNRSPPLAHVLSWLVCLSVRLECTENVRSYVLLNKVGPMYYLQDLQLIFSSKKILKLGPTILFTYLKIILLQFYQFSIFNNKRYLNRPENLYIYFLLLMVNFNWCFSWM